MSDMTDTLRERLNQLIAKWERQAQRLDDYRGIQMCMKDVEDAIRLTDVPPEAKIKAALKQATDLLAQLRGKPFVPQMKDLIKTLDDSCITIRALVIQNNDAQKKINTLSRELEVALMPKPAPSVAAKVVNA